MTGMEFKREFVSENETTKTYIIREKKFPFHAICVDKKTGIEIEQASNSKAHAIQLAQREIQKKSKALSIKDSASKQVNLKNQRRNHE